MSLDLTPIIVAAIGSGGLVTVAWMNRREHKQTKETVTAAAETLGTKNGHGTVVTMLETLLTKVGRIEQRLDDHEANHAPKKVA